MKIYTDSNLLIKRELLRRAEFEQGPKTFDNLRYSQRMVPPPIKMSNGKGITALYPPCVLTHLKRIMRERRKGLKYSEIKEALAKETEEVFAETERVRRQVEAHRQARLELSTNLRSFQPDFVMYSGEGKDRTCIIGEVKIQSAAAGLKRDLQAWDGKSLGKLAGFRQRIEYIQALQAKQQVAKALMQEVNI